MRRLNILLFFSLLTSASFAQFVNNGATVTIQSGATLRVETNFVNNAGGTITNNGTLEVTNNFTNAGTFTSGSTSTVKFIGGSPSSVTPGESAPGVPTAFRNVEMAKTNENITLLGPAAINGTLTFSEDNNKVILGDHNLTINNMGSIVSADDNEYVVTNGAGLLIKGLDDNDPITHEIGDMTNYTPLNSAVTATGAGTLGARVYTTPLQGKYADATDYINREWQVVSTGAVTGNTMTGTYVDGDIQAGSTKALIKGATHHTMDWRFNGSTSNAASNTITASTTNADVKFSGQNFFGKANLKAYLAGALPSGTTMTNTLRTNNLIPVASPYSAAPFNAPSVTAPSIPVNATDWILVEVRDASTPATLVSQTSAFILTDGTIVNMDGQTLRLKNAVASGHIALKHRNHLGIRTASALNLVEPPTLKDFSAGTSEAFTDLTAAANNTNMIQVGSVYAMWSGNANNDDRIKYSGSGTDVNAISTSVFTNPLNTSFSPSFPLIGYHGSDLNMNGEVKYSGSGTDVNIISSNIYLNPLNVSFSPSFPIVKHLEN